MFSSYVWFEEFVQRSLGASLLTKPCLAPGKCKNVEKRVERVLECLRWFEVRLFVESLAFVYDGVY